MDDLISDFLTEANESLEIVDAELVNFEAKPEDRAALDKIFRLVHSIKGTSGFLGLPRLEAVAHAGETLLGRFRDGKLAVSSDAVTLVLRSIDTIKAILDGLAASGSEPAGDDSGLIGELEAMSEDAPAGLAEEVVAAPVEEPRVLRPGEVSMEDLEAAFAAAEGPSFDFGDEPAPVESAQIELAQPEPVQTAQVAEASGEEGGPAATNQSIRVGVEVLEDMMTLVSELVLTRNQLLQLNRSRTDDAFVPPLQRLSTITGELQDSVMKTRMQPIGAAWKKLPRLVRDLSKELGKKIDLVMDGETTELDRQVLEQIRDPLTHMVRNSADHGLETPEQRRAAGKSDVGTIRLAAFHEGGSIVIRVQDDGRGLDTARIREKAIEKGLVSRTDAEALTDAQVHRLVFSPGFSTAAAVTNVSGRGVGMDVVRSNIEQIGGQIELNSTAGQGSGVTIKIPLTLAIVSALIVGAGGERFAVPQGYVVELIKVDGEDTEHRIETIEHIRMVRLREELVPLIDLSAELGRTARRPATFVMVMQVGQHRFGVIVDEVIDTEEIVVKPLAAALRNISVFSGATILGDGSVVLIVDPNGLTERAGEIPASAQKAIDEAAAWGEAEGLERKSLLVVRVGEGQPKAVELSKVTRLEHADASRIERNGHRASLQYRGRLMTVLTVDESQMLRSSGVQPLLVFTGALYSMALAVDEIVDVVDAQLKIELTATRPGLLGVAVVDGKATDILDIDHFMLLALAEQARSDDPANSSVDTREAA